MTEFSQAKVNELIDQYRDGTISKEDRFKLEKQAMDDPFLFDALEGYAIEKEIENKKGSTRIFTLPRLGIAASLIIMIAVIFNLKSNLNTQAESDQSIAMVLESEEEISDDNLEFSAEAAIKDESASSIPAADNEIDNNLPDIKEPIQNRKLKAPAKKERSELDIENSQSTNPIKEESEPITGMAGTEEKDKKGAEDITSDEESVVSLQDYDVVEEISTDQDSKDILVIKNVNNFEAAQQASESTIMDSSLNPKYDLVKKAKAQVVYIAEPVIGKDIFDDYAKQQIDEKGLRQSTPQKVTIEFSINSNGELTDFHHIFTGCSECGSFAIAILQNSGEWKTIPPGSSGRARYTFNF